MELIVLLDPCNYNMRVYTPDNCADEAPMRYGGKTAERISVFLDRVVRIREMSGRATVMERRGETHDALCLF